MKPYGVIIEQGPDIAEIKEMGSKSSCGQIAGKSGDYHPICKGLVKDRARRRWARRARAEGKNACTKIED